MTEVSVPIEFDEIARMLPQAYPMLLVDRVVSASPPSGLTARKCVTGNEPFFQGHFRNGPAIMPGVLVLEALGQAAQLLGVLSGTAGQPGGGSPPSMLAEVRATFHQPVCPGDVLTLTIELDTATDAATSYKCVATTESGQVVARARILGVRARGVSIHESGS